MSEELTLIYPPIRTRCYPDENPIGYLMRLANSNTYPTYRWLLEGKGADTVISFERLYQVYLASNWTGYQQAELELGQICALPNIHVNAVKLRYCPLCLQEEYYWRIGWQLKLAVACTRHWVWLQDACPHCHKEPSLIKAQGNYSNCFEQLVKAEAVPVPPSIVYMQQFLEKGALAFENHLFNGDYVPTLLQRCELLTFMLKWLLIGEGSTKPSRVNFKHVEEFKPIASQCADALFSDEGGFWRFLQTIQFTGASLINIQQKRLVYFYRQFFSSFQEPSFQPFKEVVEQYVSVNLIRDINKKHTLFSSNVKKNQQWYSFNRACHEYNVDASVLTRAIIDKQVNVYHERGEKNYTKCSIYRPDLEKTLAHLTSLVTAYDAARVLGVTKAQFAQLQNKGCFKFEVPPRDSYCSTWQYSRWELETLIKDINKGTAPATENCLSLSSIMRNHIKGTIEMPFLQIFKAILSGKLIVRKPHNKPRKIRELWLDKNEFYQWLDQLRPKVDAMSVTEAAKILGVNDEFGYQLVNRGYLSHKVDSRKAKIIFPDHIKQFKQEYVILSKLSKESGFSSDRIIEILDDSEIFPVDHNDSQKLRQKLYARADILKTSLLYRYVQYLP
jgi:hypothetical protein